MRPFRQCAIIWLLGAVAWLALGWTCADTARAATLRVMTFNILQAGGDASNVGFHNKDFPPTRWDHVIAVIRQVDPDILCVQEPPGGDWINNTLGGTWGRAGSVYSRYLVELLAHEGRLSVARVTLPDGTTMVVGGDHWWPGAGYGPYVLQDLLRQHGAQVDAQAVEKAALATAVPHEYERPIRLLTPYLEAGEPVILAGDFNEPSHLDWTERYARLGADRWAGNPTGIPLRHKVAWPGSRRLAEAGFRDAYRLAKPDEVEHPGNTWTPIHPNGTPGREVFAEQPQDRIDMVYFHGDAFDVIDAQVVGESPETSDIVYTPWPSDHRGVVVTLRLVEPAKRDAESR